MFKIELGDIEAAKKNVLDTAEVFQKIILKDDYFYNESGDFEEEKAKEVFKNAFNNYMSVRMKIKPERLADIKDFIDRNK
jgi:hypothetical protein